VKNALLSASLAWFPKPTLDSNQPRLFGATRTRILLLYILMMAVVMAAAIPIFRTLLFRAVDVRVREDLEEELESFEEAYRDWDATDPENTTALATFVREFFVSDVPEDDNFHIVILNQQFFKANPLPLPEVIQPDSKLIQQWALLEEPMFGKTMTGNPEIGDVLYKTFVLETNDVPQGLFIAVHLTGGERQEALTSVYVFAKVATGVVLISFLLAWLTSRQLLKPVQDLAKTARTINETDLSQRLEVVGSGELADLAATFNAMMNRLQNAFDSQRNFINDAGHELRTPLTIIQGHLELMGDEPQEREETLALVMDELDRMGRFVNDLLLLAKAERTDFLRLETIDLQTFTEEVFTKATALADRQWQLGAVAQGTLVGDRQRLTGAILNLAQNATQHTKTTDIIELGSVSSRSSVRFWVRDTGDGISSADQLRIFDRFARAAHSYRRSDGAGLGLAIVKAIAESHGGTVELVSQLGIGSTFTLVLPLERSP
jgi:signal transduction histidine kinase